MLEQEGLSILNHDIDRLVGQFERVGLIELTDRYIRQGFVDFKVAKLLMKPEE